MEDVAPPPQDPNPSSSYDDGAKEGENSTAPAPLAEGALAPTTNGDSMMNDSAMADGATTTTTTTNNTNNEDGQMSTGGNLYLRPIFFGNLSHSCLASDLENIFKNPAPPVGGQAGEIVKEFDLDRVDMKRGYAFVFLKDPPNQAEKERCEKYVQDINGMNISQVSNALRAEFARGDGRVKKKEDERRKKITPNETLFVVNFHEETTKREDLQMLFEPYGELVRIDMKRNYAFVQFKTIDEAIRAKDATNGGKLDQSEITVEYVARRMGEGGGGRDRPRRRYDDDRGGRGGGGGYRGGGGGRDDRRRDDRPRERGGYRGDKYDDDRRGGYRDDRRRRSRSRSRSPGYRRRSRSRSPGYDRDHRSSRDEYRPSSRGGREEGRGGREESRGGREEGTRPSREEDRGYGRSY